MMSFNTQLELRVTQACPENKGRVLDPDLGPFFDSYFEPFYIHQTFFVITHHANRAAAFPFSQDAD